ncbi:MAG: DNA translocase FtsK 4TM domain-containing protein, partial [Bacteroidales bacterium]|nr:DNA translocase FtsK 4TM domain-containing protein [Bacteroidales bacterium]
MEKDTKKKKTADNFKKDIKDKPTTKEKPMNMITSTIHSELFIRVVGTFFVLLSVFLFFSFVSFFISWKLDYNIVESSSAWDLLSGSKNIKNWGGTIGAFLSYIMIVSSFGIASFGYILIFTIIGLRFFGIKFNTFGRIIIYTFIIMLWLSSVIGFVVYFFKLENFYELAGVVGISINTWLHSFSGNVGAILILIFFTITLPMIMFGVKYTFIKDIFQKISKQADNKKESNIEIPKEVESKENESDDINPIQEDIKLSPTNISKEQSNDIDGLTELEKEKLLQFEIKENQTQNSLQP